MTYTCDLLSRLATTVAAVRTGIDDFRLDDASLALYRFFWNELCDWYIELCKPALQVGAEPGARRAALGTLAHVLETSLRLLHPFIPFITEEIWVRLPRPSGAPASCVITMYPSAEESLVDAAAEQVMATLQTTIAAIRNVRSSYSLTGASGRPEFVVKTADEGTRRALLDQRPLVELLSRAQLVDVVADYPQTRGVIANVVEGQTVLLLHAVRVVFTGVPVF